MFGFPVGIFLSKLCRDEIVAWRKRLIMISVVSLLIAIGISFTSFEFQFPSIIALFFVIIMNLVIVWKSY